MKLNKDQRETLLHWIGEGLDAGEINRRAEAFTPPFRLTRGGIQYWKRKIGMEKVEEVIQEGNLDALRTGLAKKEERVKVLQQLAARLLDDIDAGGDWLQDVKVSQGKVIYLERYNAPIINEIRGILDDIAKEMGDRRANVQHSSDPANPVEIVHFYIPDNGRPHPGRPD